MFFEETKRDIESAVTKALENLPDGIVKNIIADNKEEVIDILFEDYAREVIYKSGYNY